MRPEGGNLGQLPPHLDVIGVGNDVIIDVT